MIVMINPNANTKFIAISSESFDDITLKMSKAHDILEEKGYDYISSNIFTESSNGAIRKVHAVLIYGKRRKLEENEQE